MTVSYWKSVYKKCFSEPGYILSLVLGFCLFMVSLVVNYMAGTYATNYSSNAVTDIILSNIPVFNLDIVFVHGSTAMAVLITAVCLVEPRRIPFVIKSIALFTLIRSLFVVLTHIAPYPTHIIIDPASYLNKFSFGGDLFFSGHTGLPFLMALIYWKNKVVRGFFLCFSILFAVVVLLAHLHYSIDVAAAFFITFSIYKISMWLFNKDYKKFI